MIGLVVTITLFPLVGWSIGRRSLGEAFLIGAGLTGTLLFLAGLVHVPLVAALAVIVVLAIIRIATTSRAPDTRHPTPDTRLATAVMCLPLIALTFITAST